MDALKAINSRTSYRGPYKDAPVPRGDLEKILEAGLAAPSGCNTQTTSLIAVDDPALLAKIKGVVAPVGKTAPAMICVLTKRIIAYRDRYFNVQDYSAAIENILLAIVALGYESCWYEGQMTDVDNIGRQVADLLGVPGDMELICILPVGYAAEPVKHASKRPFAERAWFNGYMK